MEENVKATGFNKWNVAAALLCVAILAGSMIVFIVSQNRKTTQIESDGVYVIGKAYQQKGIGTQNPDTYFIYVYNDTAYSYAARGGSKSKRWYIDDLILLHISTSHPEYSIPARPSKVCACFKYEDSPDKGWKEIPECRKTH